ncbi:flagellar basal body-associated protein FliL [Nitrosovibrio tenuis]|uniref:Flagellar protein FliL n=1 Tax=Nitrosovibrio tenuis TaxID=1233 RepID=A0A1H7J2W5_9PROT|nr:flagellar basal body-associated protein FliL [Nitrosovibrio tenuis]SEK69103.1 flagellar FliL protein [Nitrosovibrio tenuis]
MASRPIKHDKDSREVKVEQKSSKSSKLKLILAIASAVLLLGAGGGGAAWYFVQAQDGATAAAKQKPPVFIALETFTVNLQPEHSDQHLQTNLTFRVADTGAVDLIKLHMPVVRNRILLLLSSKTASQIATVEGKKKLATELAAEVNHPFAEGGTSQTVESVLFTSFVIQ